MARSATLNPLCDKHGAHMSSREVLIEECGAADLLTAFVCTFQYCDRCYSEGTGYFDFIEGKTDLDSGQMLCETDAMPMFLEIISSDDAEIWRCPRCSRVTARSW